MTVANRDRSVSVEDFSSIISLDYGSVDGVLRLNDITGAAGKTWSRRDSRVLSMFSTASLMMIFGCGESNACLESWHRSQYIVQHYFSAGRPAASVTRSKYAQLAT